MELIAECCRTHETMWATLADDTQFRVDERQVFGVLEALWSLSRYHMPQSREELVTWLLCEASLLHRRIGRVRHTPVRLKNQRDPVKKLVRRATRQHRGKGLLSDKSECSRLWFAA
jgi:hypothetical protein